MGVAIIITVFSVYFLSVFLLFLHAEKLVRLGKHLCQNLVGTIILIQTAVGGVTGILIAAVILRGTDRGDWMFQEVRSAVEYLF